MEAKQFDDGVGATPGGWEVVEDNDEWVLVAPKVQDLSEEEDLQQNHGIPQSYIVSGAGSDFVNGTYYFAGNMDGPVPEIKYQRKALLEDGSTKKLTIAICTMRSQQKWWFISEEDKDQPGTDLDIDYYLRKQKEAQSQIPPITGWTTSKNAKGLHPPPLLAPRGLLTL